MQAALIILGVDMSIREAEVRGAPASRCVEGQGA